MQLRQEKEIKVASIGKREIKWSFADNIIMYIENSEESTDKLFIFINYVARL